jgi:ArsR family transcriptional regulator, arsenate/arsenite/antimonite-responsive transcriptional repressor
MRDFLNMTKALSDESRVRILLSLRGKELCLCQMVAMLGLASSTVSKHLSILHQANLVHVRKDGRWRYYRLPTNGAPRNVADCLKWMKASLAKDEAVAGDVRKLKEILKTPVEEFCKTLNQCR